MLFTIIMGTITCAVVAWVAYAAGYRDGKRG